MKLDSPCWIENPLQSEIYSKGFISENVSKIKNDKISVRLLDTNEPRLVSVSQVKQRNPVTSNYDDMVNMEILNEAELLENLRERYKIDKFQTFVGPALLVINPFKKVDQIYN